MTEIAFRWGFGNLGRFSRLFEEKYGLKPHAALRFQPGRNLKAA
ncbi:hypothetical protein [Hoeflea poritis]